MEGKGDGGVSSESPGLARRAQTLRWDVGGENGDRRQKSFDFLTLLLRWCEGCGSNLIKNDVG